MDSILQSIQSNISLRGKEEEQFKQYIWQRVEECLKLDKNELNKKAIDLGKNAHDLIEKSMEKAKAQIEDYVRANIDTIYKNKYEIFHISELEALSDQPLYRDGKIVKECGRIVIFSR